MRCPAAVDADRTVHGVMELLVAAAARTFRDEGAEFASLSGAPLAQLEPQQADGPQRVLDRAGHALEPVCGFRSLPAFGAKFRPRYEPLFLTYPDPVALPAIGVAVGHAYLPDLTARQSARLVARMRERPTPG